MQLIIQFTFHTQLSKYASCSYCSVKFSVCVYLKYLTRSIFLLSLSDFCYVWLSLQKFLVLLLLGMLFIAFCEDQNIFSDFSWHAFWQKCSHFTVLACFKFVTASFILCFRSSGALFQVVLDFLDFCQAFIVCFFASKPSYLIIPTHGLLLAFYSASRSPFCLILLDIT